MSVYETEIKQKIERVGISQQGPRGQKGKREGVHMALLIKQHERTYTCR